MSNYEDYANLPLAVLEDARLVAEGESVRQKREEAKRGKRR